jgi:hypothetical protein
MPNILYNNLACGLTSMTKAYMKYFILKMVSIPSSGAVKLN